MITVISDDARQGVGRQLKAALERMGERPAYFDLSSMDIRPCTGCGSCSGRTLGHCVQKDDMLQILDALKRGQTWALVSPVVFGTCSPAARRFQERTCTLADPRYYLSAGELVKGYGRLGGHFHAVGVLGDDSPADAGAFLALHRENIRIMNCQGQAFVLPAQPQDIQIDQVAEAMRHG